MFHHRTSVKRRTPVISSTHVTCNRKADPNEHSMLFALCKFGNGYLVAGCYAGVEVVRRQNDKWAFTSSVKSKPRLMSTNTFWERKTVLGR